MSLNQQHLQINLAFRLLCPIKCISSGQHSLLLLLPFLNQKSQLARKHFFRVEVNNSLINIEIWSLCLGPRWELLANDEEMKINKRLSRSRETWHSFEEVLKCVFQALNYIISAASHVTRQDGHGRQGAAENRVVQKWECMWGDRENLRRHFEKSEQE